MKNLIIILLSAFLISSCIPHEALEPDPIYTVKVTFCDTRPPDTIEISWFREPSNNDVSTYKRAVPEWNGYLNVCDLKTLSWSDSLSLK